MNELDQSLSAALEGDDVEQVRETLRIISQRRRYRLLDEIEAFLASEEPALRAAAIEVLAADWRLPEYAEDAENMWRTEQVEGPRMEGLRSWILLHDKSEQPRVLRELYIVLTNEGLSETFRSLAYWGVLRVAGLPRAKWPSQIGNFRNFKVEVDWTLVNKLVAGKPTKAPRPRLTGQRSDEEGGRIESGSGWLDWARSQK